MEVKSQNITHEVHGQNRAGVYLKFIQEALSNRSRFLCQKYSEKMQILTVHVRSHSCHHGLKVKGDICRVMVNL